MVGQVLVGIPSEVPLPALSRVEGQRHRVEESSPDWEDFSTHSGRFAPFARSK